MMKDGQDLFAVRRDLAQQIELVRAELPGVIEAQIVFDQSTNVRHRLAGFTRDFAIAILLVLVTLCRWACALGGVMISIPLSLAIGLSLLRFAGFSINQLSIVGFVIALGLLVDDSIVVVENIARHLREGKGPIDAAIEGTKQIAVSVLGCTATLLFAFLPLLFLPGGPASSSAACRWRWSSPSARRCSSRSPSSRSSPRASCAPSRTRATACCVG